MDDRCTNCGMIVEAGWNPRRAISGRPYCPLCFTDIMNEDQRSSWSITTHVNTLRCACCGGMLNPIGIPMHWVKNLPACFDCFAKSTPSYWTRRFLRPWHAWDGDSGSEEYTNGQFRH